MCAIRSSKAIFASYAGLPSETRAGHRQVYSLADFLCPANAPMRIILIVLLGILFLLGRGLAQEHVDTKDRIAAIVNDDVITLSELQEQIDTVMPQLNAQVSGEELQQQAAQLRYKLLVAMIEQKLQLQQADRMRLSVSDREVDSSVQERRARQGADPTSPPTEGERKAAREQLLLMKVYQQKIRSTLLVPEATLHGYYEAHPEAFTFEAEVHISQIMLRADDSGSLEHARLRSEHVLKEIDNGRSFEDLAKDYSDGPEAKNGGSLGVMTRGSLLPQIEEIVDRLSPGEIGPVVESPVGLHIIRVDTKKPQGLRPFDEVKEGIESKLLREQSQLIYQEWLNELKDNAFIEIRL